MNNAIPVFIGYDEREPEAYEVCKASLLKHASIPLHIIPLKEKPLREAGLYTRKFHMDGKQRIDDIDGKPFSTDFSFTRFLVPALCQWEGPAMFVDSDFLFRKDFWLAQVMNSWVGAVWVCKQKYEPQAALKMDGQAQQRYKRKNWSSLMIFNCGECNHLTPATVNMEPGSWLHGFEWCRDEEIGALPPQWNWIDGTTDGEPSAVHFTAGGPWFEHLRWSNAPYFEEWREAAKELGLWPHRIEKAA